MRIIAGEKRSRILTAPEGMDTRPTADKVREALFSILSSRVWDARVLDLYAGSGALSLEALSRGAASAVLVDKDRKAQQAIRRNIEALEYGKQARVLPVPDTVALAQLEREGERFDLIFLDPPYKMDTAAVCDEILQKGLLADDGIIIIEHRKDTPPVPGAGFEITDTRHYGIAGLMFLKKKTDGGKENRADE